MQSVWIGSGSGRAGLDGVMVPVASDEASDLVIIGGGFFGLSTARHAARSGLSVRVIDAGRIGEGASGLNGGQVIPGLKFDPDALIARFGADQGQRLVDFAAGTADAVFDLISRERLAVPHHRSGWIQAAHTETALAAAAARHAQWAARGADVALLDRQQIADMTGAEGYLGGFWDRRAGIIDPLALAQEMAWLAAKAGARIAEGKRATRLARIGDRWQVTLASGETLLAARVLVATNAYSDGLVPGLMRSLVALHSFQVATAILPDADQARILPGNQAVSDSRRILVYYRKTADGRLILGGRGPMRLPRTSGDWHHVEHALRRLFPALADIPIERRWFGRVAMTPDHLPHIHEPEPGLLAVAGCQGRGVGLMTALGEPVSRYLATGDASVLPFPITPLRPIPFHRFRRIGVAATIAWYRLLDAMER